MRNYRIIIISIIIITLLIWVVIQSSKTSDGYFYGSSYRQNKIVNTIRLHKYGITGERIKIGIIDAGFYTKHPVFANTRIIKEYDFVSGKSSTSDYNHITGMDHGTNVFSVVGGYKINELIGIAFGANFILAKTDISTDRLKEEEINAVKASRWLSENGANIITTSLSFNKFDNADYYYPNQMNGTVAEITKIADSLVNKGIVFFCSTGNNYEEEWHIIEPPGDGFGVLSVGSIDKNLIHSFFSSCGPTVDGRIKPDLVTPGEGVWNANYLPKIKPEFSWNHGTSLSAPIAAGIAALVLSAHPDLSALQIIEAIKKTSSKSNSPDTLYGWGIPDAEKAVSYFGPAFTNTPELKLSGNKIEINTYVLSSYGLDSKSVETHVVEGNDRNEFVYNMRKTNDNLYTCTVNINLGTEEVKIYFKAKDLMGQTTKYPSGILGENFVFQIADGNIKNHLNEK